MASRIGDRDHQLQATPPLLVHPTVGGDTSATAVDPAPHDNDRDKSKCHDPRHWSKLVRPDRGLTNASVLCACTVWIKLDRLQNHYKNQCPLTENKSCDMSGQAKVREELCRRAASIPIKSQVNNSSKSNDGDIVPCEKHFCPDCGHISMDKTKALNHKKSERICKGSNHPVLRPVVQLRCGTWVLYDATPTTAPLAIASTPKKELVTPLTPTSGSSGRAPYPQRLTSIDVPNERMSASATYKLDQTTLSLVKQCLCPSFNQAKAVSGLFHHRVAANPTSYAATLIEDYSKVDDVVKDPPQELARLICQLKHDLSFAETITRELPGNVLAKVQNFHALNNSGDWNPDDVKSRGCFSPRDSYAPIVKLAIFVLSYIWVFHRQALDGPVEFMGRNGYTVQEGYRHGIVAGLVYDLVVKHDSVSKALIPMFDAMALMSITMHGKYPKVRSNDEVARLISNMLHFIRLFGGCAKTLLYMSHPDPEPSRQPTDIVEEVNRSSLVHHLSPILHSTRAEHQARPKTRDVHADQAGNITVRSFQFPAAALSQLYPNIINELTSLLDLSLGKAD